MSAISMADYVANPSTGRLLKVGSAKYKRFVKLGQIVSVDIPLPELEPEANVPKSVPTTPFPRPVSALTHGSVRGALTEEFTTIVADHVDQLVDLTQKQTEKLLKKYFMRNCAFHSSPRRPRPRPRLRRSAKRRSSR